MEGTWRCFVDAPLSDRSKSGRESGHDKYEGDAVDAAEPDIAAAKERIESIAEYWCENEDYQRVEVSQEIVR